MSEPEIRSLLSDFIIKQFPAFHGRSLDVDDSLLEMGVIDSLGILEIVTFIEQRFGITLTDDEMVSENFSSVRTLSAMIASRCVTTA